MIVGVKTQSSSKTAPKNISVYLRVRPPVSREKDHTFNNINYNPTDPRCITVRRPTGANCVSKSYYFDGVFKPTFTQGQVYEAFAKNAVNAAFDGQHGVLFVYGQTGSGKTYTISNDEPNNLGVLQQAMREMWERIDKDTENDYQCSVSYVQLYNEILTDLLDNSKGRVRIQMGPEGCGDVILVAESTGLPVEKPVGNYADTMAAYNLGASRKEMTNTSMNLTSSRSHTVFTLYVKKTTKKKVVTVGDDEAPQSGMTALEGRLVLCDLAGSERVSKTHAEGKTLDEATHINGSLLVLGKVVAALTEKKQHAPFRESKLTRILQYSLLGNGNTSIVVNISPSDDNTEESLSAIGFGQRAIQIKQDAKRHEVLDYRALYLQLMADLDAKNDKTLSDALDEERLVYEDRISSLNDQINTLTAENTLLRKENALLRSGVPPANIAALMTSAPSCLSAGDTGEANDWQSVNLHLREMLTARDEQIRVISDERVRLALLLSQEKRVCFRLAQQMRNVATQYKMDRETLSKRVDDLNAELAALKGTDYLSAVGSLQASPGSPGGANDSNSVMGESVSVTQDLNTALNCIRSLREERREMIIYQAKALKAIRMLVAEKEALLKERQENREVN